MDVLPPALRRRRFSVALPRRSRTPMVMLSRPRRRSATLYAEPRAQPAAGPRPSRCAPVMGPRLGASARGRRAPGATQADAAAVPRRADARLRASVMRRRRRTREIDDLAARARRSPLHPRMQAVTLEVIMSAVFGVTDPVRARARCASCCARLLDGTRRPSALQFSVHAGAPHRRRRPARAAAPRSVARDRRAAAGRDRRAAGRPGVGQREDILSLLAPGRALRRRHRR